MKNAATRDFVFTRRPGGAVRLNIGLAPAQPPVTPADRAAEAMAETPPSEDVHPLLLLYPFDPPRASATCPGRDASSAPDGTLPKSDPPADQGSEVFGCDLDEVAMAEDAGPALQAETHAVRISSRGGRSRRRKAVRRMRLPAVSELEGLWARHGMLLSVLIVCHMASSYQIAAAYRHFMRLGASAASLMPAMFLVLMFASFVVVRLMDGRRCESVAVSIIAMTGGSAFIGLLCKVVLIVRGMA